MIDTQNPPASRRRKISSPRVLSLDRKIMESLGRARASLDLDLS